MSKNLKKVKIITKVGTIKEVRFPMDEPTYKIWLNPTIPEDVKLRYFAELYYSYVDEDHYFRNHIPFSDLTQKQWHELNEKSIEQQEEEIQKKEDEEELNAAIATLSEKQQYVINRTRAGMSGAQIAKEMGVSKQAVRKAKKLAIRNLRAILSKDD